MIPRDMSGISQNKLLLGVGWAYGICKVGYAKEVSQAGQIGFGEVKSQVGSAMVSWSEEGPTA